MTSNSAAKMGLRRRPLAFTEQGVAMLSGCPAKSIGRITMSFEDQIDLNRRAYESLRDEIRHDCAGRYVAIAQGRLIAAAPTYDEAVAAIRRLDPEPECFLVFEADEDPNFDVVTDFLEGIAT